MSYKLISVSITYALQPIAHIFVLIAKQIRLLIVFLMVTLKAPTDCL